jgi:hypothetical protein
MPQARGVQAGFALYDEDTYGQDPEAPDGHLLYLSKAGVAKQQNRIDSNVLSNSRGRVEPFLGNINVNGPLETELSALSSARMLRHTMGAVTSNGAGPYSHVLTVGDLPLSFTAEIDYGAAISGLGRYVKYNGCKINSAQFEFPAEGACTVSYDVIGADGVLASAPLDATLTDTGHTTFSAFSASIEEGGAAIANVKSVSLNVANDLDQSAYVIGGKGKRGALVEQFSSISGTLTAVFDDTALMQKALGDTQTSLKITLSRGDGLGSLGNESMEFLVQQMKYDPTTPSVDGPGGVEIALPFKAFKLGTDLGLQITINNSIATI